MNTGSKTAEARNASFRTSLDSDSRTLTLHLGGWFNADTIGTIWAAAHHDLSRQKFNRLHLDASNIAYCDGAGVALIASLQQLATHRNATAELTGLKPDFQALLNLLDPSALSVTSTPKPQPAHLPEEIGKAAHQLWQDMSALVGFVGELTAALAHAAANPRKIRWRDALLAAEQTGVNALPIVALISFLIGLIMAFQSAVPMRQFGVEIFVADLVALSMLRELGPLMTAIILAGRSGSAFAAEIGTMKVNEEINALTTMGLDPVRFLVVTRVIAAVAMTPLLTLFSNLMGLIGGSVVLLSMDYPLITYLQEVQGAVQFKDLFTGITKAVVFGLLVAGIGCLRGLQTRTGASAVGLSTTSAVVSGIVLIVLADGVFSVVFYYLGI